MLQQLLDSKGRELAGARHQFHPHSIPSKPIAKLNWGVVLKEANLFSAIILNKWKIHRRIYLIGLIVRINESWHWILEVLCNHIEPAFTKFLKIITNINILTLILIYGQVIQNAIRYKLQVTKYITYQVIYNIKAVVVWVFRIHFSVWLPSHMVL